MEETYKALCLSPINGRACGRCVWTVRHRKFLSRMNFNEVLGLITSLVDSIKYYSDTMCLELSESTCRGTTRLYKSVKRGAYKDILESCRYIIQVWEVNSIPTSEEIIKADQILEILDLTENIFALKVALNNMHYIYTAI